MAQSQCLICRRRCRVTVKGLAGKHTDPATQEPCPGSNQSLVASQKSSQAPTKPQQPPFGPLSPGTTGSPTRPSAPPVDGEGPEDTHRVQAIIEVSYDLPVARDLHEEQVLLFEDPAHLYRVLDHADNHEVSVALRRV